MLIGPRKWGDISGGDREPNRWRQVDQRVFVRCQPQHDVIGLLGRKVASQLQTQPRQM